LGNWTLDFGLWTLKFEFLRLLKFFISWIFENFEIFIFNLNFYEILDILEYF
jgi:hypothetical protein